MHTSIIIISSEPALGINEPLKLAQIKDLNERGSKSNAELSLCLFMLFKFTHTNSDTHPVPSEAIDQLLRAKVTS